MSRITRLLIIAPIVLSALTGCPAAAPQGPGGGSESGGGGRPLTIESDRPGPDGCPTVELDTSGWGALTANWHDGDDPFFQIHDNEPGFYANLEAYTVWGDDWTGQAGTFAPDCNGTGLYFWLVPDDEHAFLATAGEVDVVA